MKEVRDWLKNHYYLFLLLTSILIISLFFPVSVKVGTVTRCYYGEIIKKEINEAFVPWWMRSWYKVETQWALCSRHKKAEEIYSTWRDLLKAGKKEEARFYLEKLEALVGSNWSPAKRVAGNRSATSKARAKGGGAGAVNNSSEVQSDKVGQNKGNGGSDNGLPGEEETGNYSGDLYSLLPASLDGYEFFLKEEYPLQAVAMARPLKDKNVVMVLFSVERVDNRTAEKYFDGFKESYGKDGQEVKVDGLKAYWGKTSDSQKALLAWRRLDLLYVIELTSRVDAGNYRSKMVEWGSSLF